jgi:hypothetical protein
MAIVLPLIRSACNLVKQFNLIFIVDVAQELTIVTPTDILPNAKMAVNFYIKIMFMVAQ